MTSKTAEISRRIGEWLRHPRVWGFAVAVVAIYVVSILFFYPDNFAGNTLQQADMQQGAANGHEAQAYYEQTGEKALWTNSLFSGMPTFQISPSYPSNSLFSWIDTVYGGFLPAPSNLLFMMMLGCLILLTTMRMPWYYSLLGAIAWGFSSYYIIIIGAGHIWKFVTLAYVPPTIAGLVLCYRGRYIGGMAMTALFAMMQLNANHPQMSYYFAFVMAGFAIAYLCDAIREKRVKRWCIATACVLGAGGLAFAANLPSLYNTYEYAKETKRSQSELTPLKSSNASADAPRPTGGMPYNDIVGWSYGTTESLSLLVPNIKGGASAVPQAGHLVPATLDRLPIANQMDPSTQYILQFFPQYFNDSEGTNGPVYVGAIICALFLLGCIIVRGPLKWVLLALTVISMLLALGRNFPALTDFMIYNFPMYNKFRAVESILVIAEFTMPLLAVLGLYKLFSETMKNKGKFRVIAVLVAFGIPMLISFAFWASPTLAGNAITSADKEVLSQLAQQSGDDVLVKNISDCVSTLRMDMVSSDAGRSFLYLLWGLLLVLAGIYFKVADKWIVGSLAVVVLIDLYTVDKRYVMSEAFISPQADYYSDPHAPDNIDKFILQDTDENYRVMDIPGFDSPARSYHHKMIGGYHAAKLKRYEDLIQRRMMYVRGIGYDPSLRDSVDLSQYSDREQKIIEELRADYRVLDMLNARYIITGDPNYPIEPNFNALGNAWLVDTIYYVDNADAEMAALKTLEPGYEAVADKRFATVLGESPKPINGVASITMTEYTPNKLTYEVETPSEAIAVFSEIYFPWGWRATIDGEPSPLGRVDYVLRAMRVPAGKHTIVMSFDPQSLHVTGSVAYAAVTIIYMIVLLSLFMAFLGKGKGGKDEQDDLCREKKDADKNDIN